MQCAQCTVCKMQLAVLLEVQRGFLAALLLVVSGAANAFS